ncbi:hypothetical protein [Rhodanobacter sp. C01]|uniref:hypothetical protein n=1 Tax=Rhodanobacter sp. C01 TaxID=1945856 RepID=UPI000985591E|nr:hypothetical protein [Rhodanobacter sp. C01]OOG46712.1 hypothetical protein B0E50_11955 [Rhodanobacter sp. C01]
MSIQGHVVATGDAAAIQPLSLRAIFAGWLIATGIAALLYLGGLALGFSSFDSWNAASSAKGIGIGTAIWMIITWVASLFLGGMFASWFDGRNDDTSGAVYGVSVWGVSMVVTSIWIACGLSHAISGHGMVATQHPGAAPQTQGPAMMAPAAVTVLDANIAHLISQAGDHDRDASRPITAALIADENETASALFAADTGVSQADAAGSLARLAPEVQSAQREAKAAADRGAHYLAMTLWIAFISALLALLASAIGGWMGAAHVHRVYHLRNYPGRL